MTRKKVNFLPRCASLLLKPRLLSHKITNRVVFRRALIIAHLHQTLIPRVSSRSLPLLTSISGRSTRVSPAHFGAYPSPPCARFTYAPTTIHPSPRAGPSPPVSRPRALPHILVFLFSPPSSLAEITWARRRFADIFSSGSLPPACWAAAMPQQTRGLQSSWPWSNAMLQSSRPFAIAMSSTSSKPSSRPGLRPSSRPFASS